MHSPLLNSLEQILKVTAAICLITSIATIQIMRIKANAHMEPEHRISWLIPSWKRVVDGYRGRYPQGWDYRIWQMSTVAWVTFLVLAILVAILHKPA